MCSVDAHDRLIQNLDPAEGGYTGIYHSCNLVGGVFFYLFLSHLPGVEVTLLEAPRERERDSGCDDCDGGQKIFTWQSLRLCLEAKLEFSGAGFG